MRCFSNPKENPSRIIIKPKVQAPSLRPEQLTRPTLLEGLRNASGCKVILISAPAGYGKTTLLAQWSQSEEARVPFAWLSLDEQDNDPVRMWRHVVEAVRQVAPQEDFGADVLVGMSAARQNIIEITLPMLINELAELPNRLAVVLDDYQFVTEERTH